MTDRHSAYLVVLDDDIREDDAKSLINALYLIKGVISVQPVHGGNPHQMLAAARRDDKWRKRLVEVIRDMSTE